MLDYLCELVVGDGAKLRPRRNIRQHVGLESQGTF
jgi:hypothetical protein